MPSVIAGPGITGFSGDGAGTGSGSGVSTTGVSGVSLTTYLADHEIAAANIEEAIFNGKPLVRADKPASISQNDTKCATLQGSDPAKRVGTSLLLKVMPGDRFSIAAKSYFEEGAVASIENPSALLTSLLTALGGGTNYSGTPVTELPENTRLWHDAFEDPNLMNTVNNLINNGLDQTKPSAFINYILYDENMKVIPDKCGIIQVAGNAGSWNDMSTSSDISVSQPGYLLAYMGSISTTSISMDAFNFEYYRGRVLEEDHYYPFGLNIEASSGYASENNNIKFTSKELQRKEFTSSSGVVSGLDWQDYGARMYDPQIGRWNGVDPMASERRWVSPYNFVQNNPINRADPTGALDDDYIFNENGGYVRTEVNNKPDRLIVENSKSGARQEYQFADPVADPKAIADGTINRVVFVNVSKAVDVMGKAGAFDPTNRENKWSYMRTESPGRGKLDFSYSSIPNEFPGASRDPLLIPSPMLFIQEGDDYAHNHMNFGNFLWAASGYSLGFSEKTLSWAAHFNSLTNSETNGYNSQFDSKDDQLSISRGVNFSKTNQFTQRTWTPTGGLSAPKQKKR